VLKRVRRWFVNQFLGREAGAVAAGKRGRRAQGIYWAIAGRKRLWGCAFGAAALLATLIPQPEGQQLAAGLAAIAGPLVVVGFLDKDWRSPPETVPKALAGVAAYSTTIGAVLVAVTELLRMVGADVPWAGLGLDFMEVLLPVLGYMGLATVARVSRPPA